MKVLVIEDDAETAAYILRGLHEHGHVADHVPNGQDGLFMAVGGARMTCWWWTGCCPALTGSDWSARYGPPA